MNEIKSTVTSKGQITLPKTIREVLNLNAGDQVTFAIQPNREVIMKKTIEDRKNQITRNLISLLLESKSRITIEGRPGVGKTHLLKKLMITQFYNKKIALINFPKIDYQMLVEQFDLNNITLFSIEDINDDFIHNVTKLQYDLIIFDEFEPVSDYKLKVANKFKGDLILSSIEFRDEILHEIGDYISIKIESTGTTIYKCKSLNGDFEKIQIYAD